MRTLLIAALAALTSVIAAPAFAGSCNLNSTGLPSASDQVFQSNDNKALEPLMGTWVGAWQIAGKGELCTALVIVKGKGNMVRLVYGWGDLPDPNDKKRNLLEHGYVWTNATVQTGQKLVLDIKLPSGDTAKYTMSGKQLQGLFNNTTSATLERVSGPAG